MGAIIGFLLLIALLGFAIKSPIKALTWIIVLGTTIWLLFSYTAYFFYALGVLIALGGINNIITRSNLKKRIRYALANDDYTDLAFELTKLNEKEKLTTLGLIAEVAKTNNLNIKTTLDGIFTKTLETKIINDLESNPIIDSTSIEKLMKSDTRVYSKIAPPLEINEAMNNIARQCNLETCNVKSENGKNVTLIKRRNSTAIQTNEISLDDD